MENAVSIDKSKLSILERAADFLRKVQQSGLEDRIQADIDGKNIEQRKMFATQIASLPSEQEKAERGLATAAEKAQRELEDAERRLMKARETQRIAVIRAASVPAHFEGQKRGLEGKIRELAPEFLHQHWFAYEQLLDLIRTEDWKENAYDRPMEDTFGPRQTERSKQLRAFQGEVERARSQVEALMLDLRDAAEVRKDASGLFQRIANATTPLLDQNDLRHEVLAQLRDTRTMAAGGRP